MATVKCDVPWCQDGAVWSWQRTPEELKAMRGPSIKGLRAQAQAERHLCDAHRPAWRADVYVPLGQARAKVEAQAPKRRAAVAPVARPALEAVLSELATMREERDQAQARAATMRLELARLRAELAQVRQAPDLAALLVSQPAGLAGDPLAAMGRAS